MNDPICGQVRDGYDMAARAPVDFEQLRPRLESSIVEAYAVTPAELNACGGSVLEWATYSHDGEPRHSRREFARRYVTGH